MTLILMAKLMIWRNLTMDNQDKAEFLKLMNTICDTIKPDKSGRLPKDSLNLWFEMFYGYSFEIVKWALYAHMRSAKGVYIPKPADVIAIIEGPDELTPDQIIAGARMPKTPFDAMARRHIGSHDLGHGDSFYLKSRAEEVNKLIPEWKYRARNGMFTDSELKLFIQCNVNPERSFIEGMPPVKIPNLADRYLAIEKKSRNMQDAQDRLIALNSPDTSHISDEDISDAKTVVAKLMAGVEKKGR